MRTEVLPHEIASYQANGFIMLPSFLDDDELVRWRTIADAEVAKAPPTQAALTGKGAYSIRARGMSERDAEWAALLRDPALAKVAAQLARVGSVRFGGDVISYTEPNCPATPWHCGLHEHERPYDTRDAIAVQMQLDDNTVQNKAMIFLPGTHRTAPFELRFHGLPSEDANGRTFESIFERSPEWLDVDPVAAVGPAGSALFWNPITAHGSGSNMTRTTRRYVGVTWLPGDLTWNGTVAGAVSAEVAAGLQPGAPLDLPSMPVLWPPPAATAERSRLRSVGADQA